MAGPGAGWGETRRGGARQGGEVQGRMRRTGRGRAGVGWVKAGCGGARAEWGGAARGAEVGQKREGEEVRWGDFVMLCRSAQKEMRNGCFGLLL